MTTKTVQPLHDDDYAKLDPGISLVVRWLRIHGFETTDSGDGVSKVDAIAEGEALAEPHVFMVCKPSDMIAEAHRLLGLLENLDAQGAGARIEASYNPNDGIAIISLFGLTSVAIPRRSSGRRVDDSRKTNANEC